MTTSCKLNWSWNWARLKLNFSGLITLYHMHVKYSFTNIHLSLFIFIKKKLNRKFGYYRVSNLLNINLILEIFKFSLLDCLYWYVIIYIVINTLEASTQIILFLEMLNFSIFSFLKKNKCDKKQKIFWVNFIFKWNVWN